MTFQLSRDTFSQAESIPPIQGMVVTGYSSEISISDLQEEWQIQLRSLQQWVCQLLIKNQQLRMALMEMKAKMPGEEDGGNAQA